MMVRMDTTAALVGRERYDGTRLGPLLADRGIMRAWLAGRLGVSRSHVTHVVAGRRTLDRATAERAAALLGVEFGEVFSPA